MLRCLDFTSHLSQLLQIGTNAFNHALLIAVHIHSFCHVSESPLEVVEELCAHDDAVGMHVLVLHSLVEK